MRTNYILLVTGLFLMNIFAQEPKFGDITKEELAQKKYARDPAASAVVTYRKVDITYNYVKGVGFRVDKSVYERIKIFSAEGFEYGTISESLYQSGSDRESLGAIKAVTYNLEKGKIVKSNLDKRDVFSEEVNKYRLRKKFTMPNLKEGSVIEYQYRISSPFSYNIDEILLQYDIPIVQQVIEVAIPEYFVFNERTKGYLFFDIQKSRGSGSVSFTSTNRTSRGGFNAMGTSISSSSVDFFENVSLIRMNNVPALKEEPYVNNINNYRSSIKFELQYTKFPNSTIQNYTSDWEKVVKKIYDFETFGGQLNTSRYFKDDLNTVLQGKTTDEDKMIAIYQYVKNRMNWNGNYGYTSDEGVKKAYDSKTGNIADINLILVGMLRAAGLKVNPILISTRSHGIPLFPTLEGFNYVAASVDSNGNTVLLDATNKFAKPNLLPTRALNWLGRAVDENGSSKEFSLSPKIGANEMIMLDAELSDTGELNGALRRVLEDDYAAYIFRNSYEALDEESYLGKLEENYNGIEISEYSIKDKLNIGKPVTENFHFYGDDLVEFIGDKIYFSPLLWFARKENPFKLEKRVYPIDFTYPVKKKYMIKIDIPEGYQVDYIPEGIRMVMPEKQASFIYKLGANANSVQLYVEEQMNVPIVQAKNYTILKNYYKSIIEKQLEKVVLSKEEGNGNTESTTGGR
ncbi:DUF3857 domain-containing protein [Maribacter polysiphoniae]|uniref:DUF3857 domain-containing protein n=1 Tax=Maribacter polysiphoniae TaxID=429344 RepID=UPI0023575930|nr:DUF3857 domain-containing protein [Maribacter polysiphoniae]